MQIKIYRNEAYQETEQCINYRGMLQDTNQPSRERVKHKLSEQWEGQAALQAESIPR